MYKIEFKDIAKFVKSIWNKLNIYSTRIEDKKKPFFCLSMFPYPSAIGLHIGHPISYVANDIIYRFLRMKGYNTLAPFGYDSFGLPAEQYAIKTGQHPEITTKLNIENMEKQMEELALCFDPTRKINTSDPKYYKWTQWIFLKMYNSFFDQTQIWESKFGKIEGKTKDVSILREYLQKGSWYIDEKGIPKPKNLNIKHKLQENNYSEEEISKAIDNARIAYLDFQYVNWCPQLGTVLSDEEITKDGKSERGNYPVFRKKMKQWMLRITKYADRLLDFERLDWPEETVKMQKNWIGKSIGMKIQFIDEDNNKLEVFTTRPDTLSGVTFIAVSESHPIYGRKLPFSEEKIGIFTGKYAYHIFEKTKFDSKIPILRKIPIWITNYVLNDYGSGAVMGVPAHDERDFEFAIKYELPIKLAIIPDQDWINKNISSIESSTDINLEFWKNLDCSSLKKPFCGYGSLLFSEELEVDKNASLEEVIKYFEKHNIGEKTISYRLRDWVFSRQRYWGEPFPIVYSENGDVYQVCESELPIELPQQADFAPDLGSEEPSAPLARSKEWVYIKGHIVNGKFTTKGDQKEAKTFRREINTMPNWAGSNWYYLRYLDPNNENEIFCKEARDYWCRDKFATVDLYIGGSEHAVLHCLYARFSHMVLFDLSIVPNKEPFLKVVHQGLITANAYLDHNESYVDVKDVEVKKVNGIEIAIDKNTGQTLTIEKGKMGKSYKNGVDPIEILDEHGSDVLRLHLMYMAPLTQSRPWNGNFVGMERFCQNISSMLNNAIKENQKQNKEVKINLHKTIKQVTENYESMHYNRCISLLIEFYNSSANACSIEDCLVFLRLLHPLAPQLSEYWYQKIASLNENEIFDLKKSILFETWPIYDPELLISDLIKATISINGKLKKVIEVEKNILDESLREIANSISGINNDKIIIIRNKDKLIVNVVT